jgi:hypothetical protein
MNIWITGKAYLIPILAKLFNNIINTGIYPELWVESIIIPVFKKEDVNEPKIYRGISLVSHVGQLFTGLLNKRLLKWAEQHNVLTYAQFGFRPGFGTTDAIFVLHSLITSTLRKGKRFYLTFCTFSFEFKEIGLSDIRCIIQDVVSPHCGDKRMARRCMISSLPNYVVMTSYYWNVGKTRQCRQRKQSKRMNGNK